MKIIYNNYYIHIFLKLNIILHLISMIKKPFIYKYFKIFVRNFRNKNIFLICLKFIIYIKYFLK